MPKTSIAKAALIIAAVAGFGALSATAASAQDCPAGGNCVYDNTPLGGGSGNYDQGVPNRDRDWDRGRDRNWDRGRDRDRHGWAPEQRRPYFESARPRVTCETGIRTLERRGFDRIRVRDCSGRSYTYMARDGRKLYRAEMDARTGRMRVDFAGWVR